MDERNNCCSSFKTNVKSENICLNLWISHGEYLECPCVHLKTSDEFARFPFKILTTAVYQESIFSLRSENGKKLT